MIMSSVDSQNASMLSTSAQTPESDRSTIAEAAKGGGHLLQQRLALVEDLWETVLRSECPPDQAERLLRMKQLSDPVASDGEAVSSDAVAQLIREMDLVEAIAAARAARSAGAMHGATRSGLARQKLNANDALNNLKN